MAYLSRLLDNQLLDGAHAVDRFLGPGRTAFLVKSGNADDVTEAVEYVCQLWGGACNVLVPVPSPPSIAPMWSAFLHKAEISVVNSRDLVADDAMKLGEFRVWKWGSGEPLLAVVSGIDQRRRSGRTVLTPQLDRDDPWHLAYLGVLGRWPDQPNSDLLWSAGLREDLKFFEMMRARIESVPQGDGTDLLNRLRDRKTVPPALASCFYLGRPQPPLAEHIPQAPVVPKVWAKAEEIGPNIVVVYEPGSMEDLCLLWNLRASNGLPQGFPLAVPVTADVAGTLASWVTPENPAFKAWGLRLTQCALVSMSVGSERLRGFAEEAEGLFRQHPEVTRRNYLGPSWEVVEPDVILRPNIPPARRSSDIATFSSGRSLVSGWHPNDQQTVSGRSAAAQEPQIEVRIELQDRALPPSLTLRERWNGRLAQMGIRNGWLAHGGFEAGAQDAAALLDVLWPSGWEVLSAIVADHGLRAEPSAPGKAGAALMRRLGPRDLDAFLSGGMLAELDQLTWFRRKMRALSKVVEGDTEAERRLQAIESELTAAALHEASEHHTAVTDQRLRTKVFGGSIKAAHSWLLMAEELGLIIRGTQLRCDLCGARSWRTVSDLGPPVICSGCDSSIRHPFERTDHLPFSFKPSELLMRVLIQDVLPHLLAVRWWSVVLGEGRALYGAYPGVDFFDGDKTVGEADVVLVLGDGRLVLGECKATGRGLMKKDLDQLETLASRLEASWTFLATPDWAENCDSVWRSSERRLPDSPRFALTGEKLLDLNLKHWQSIDTDRFAWEVFDAEEQAAAEATFVQRFESAQDAME